MEEDKKIEVKSKETTDDEIVTASKRTKRKHGERHPRFRNKDDAYVCPEDIFLMAKRRLYKNNHFECVEGDIDPKTGEPEKKLIDLRLGIVPSAFPVKQLTKKESDEIVKKLLECLLNEPGTVWNYKFHGTGYEQGVCIISCANLETRKWVEEKIGILNPICGKTMVVWDAADVLTSKRYLCWFPSKWVFKNADEIIEHIGSQNRGLSTKSWRVVDFGHLGPGFKLVLSVDMKTVEKLKEMEFHIFMKWSKIKLEDLTPLNSTPIGYNQPQSEKDENDEEEEEGAEATKDESDQPGEEKNGDGEEQEEAMKDDSDQVGEEEGEGGEGETPQEQMES